MQSMNNPGVSKLFALFVAAAHAAIATATRINEPIHSQDGSLLRSPLEDRIASMEGGRHLDDSGHTDDTIKGGDILMYAALILFILALTFPAMFLTFCKTCPALCCGLGSLPRDCLPPECPPAEIGCVEEPSADFRHLNDVSSFTNGSTERVRLQ